MRKRRRYFDGKEFHLQSVVKKKMGAKDTARSIATDYRRIWHYARVIDAGKYWEVWVRQRR